MKPKPNHCYNIVHTLVIGHKYNGSIFWYVIFLKFVTGPQRFEHLNKKIKVINAYFMGIITKIKKQIHWIGKTT
jgi:hypothetical protein